MSNKPIAALFEAFEPDFGAGTLTWRPGHGGSYSGKEAFTACRDDGYRVGMLTGTMLRRSRVIFAMWNNRWPEEMVDHIDGNRSNDAISNLREASARQNAANCRRSQQPGHSGFLGVTFSKRDGKWKGQVSFNNRNHNTGLYDDEIEAARARDLLALSLHGEFAKLNFECLRHAQP